jgi:hypothetical protein
MNASSYRVFLRQSLAVLFGLTCLSGCGDDAGEPAPEVSQTGTTNGPPAGCVPGQQVDCGCPSGMVGTQRCGTDGTFDTCECPSESETTGTMPAEDETSTGQEHTESTSTSSGSSSSSGDTTVGDSTGTTGDASSSSDGNGPDMGPVTESCDPWAQDCPPGHKCIAWSNDGLGAWNDTKCTPIARDPKQLDEACSTEDPIGGVDDCDIGLMCWGIDFDTNEGTCVALCDGTPEDYSCEPENTTCVISNSDSLTLCLPKCDPLEQDCSLNEACLPHDNDPDSACLTDPHCYPMTENGSFMCVFTLNLGYGDPCSYANECGAGLFCAHHSVVDGCFGNAGCCTEFCDLSDPSCSGLDMQCVPLYAPNEAPAGYEDAGGCMSL